MKQKGEETMRAFSKNTRQSAAIVRTVAAGSLLSLSMTLLLTALLSIGIDRGLVRIELSGVGAYVIIGLSAFAGCAVSAIRGKNGKLLHAMITAAVYYLILIAGKVMLSAKGSARLLPTAGIILLVSMLCGLISARERKQKFLR